MESTIESTIELLGPCKFASLCGELHSIHPDLFARYEKSQNESVAQGSEVHFSTLMYAHAKPNIEIISFVRSSMKAFLGDYRDERRRAKYRDPNAYGKKEQNPVAK